MPHSCPAFYHRRNGKTSLDGTIAHHGHRLLSQSGIPLPGAQGADNPIHPYIQRGRKRMVST